MGVANMINLIEIANCEDLGNASNFRDLPVARRNGDGHHDSRVALAISCDRDGSYFWHHFAGGGHIDLGSASDGTDISGRARYKAGPAVSAMGLVRLPHTNQHRAADVFLGSHEDVR